MHSCSVCFSAVCIDSFPQELLELMGLRTSKTQDISFKRLSRVDIAFFVLHLF